MIAELVPAIIAAIIGASVVFLSKSSRIILKETFLHPFKRTNIKIHTVEGKKEYTVSNIS